MTETASRSRKPARARYFAENRRMRRKEQRVLASSHGRWTHEALVAHQRENAGRKTRPEVSREEAEERRLLKVYRKELARFRRSMEVLRGFAAARKRERAETSVVPAPRVQAA